MGDAASEVGLPALGRSMLLVHAFGLQGGDGHLKRRVACKSSPLHG